MKTNTKRRTENTTVTSPSARWYSSELPVDEYQLGRTRTLMMDLPVEEEVITQSKIPLKGFNYVHHSYGKLLSIASYTGDYYIGHPETNLIKWETVDVGSALWKAGGNLCLRVCDRFAGTSSVPRSGKVTADYLRKLIKIPPRFVSILNFIAELRDLKSMFNFWRGKRNALVNVANTNLAWQYGWRLFLQDVCSIMEAIRNCRRLMKEFLGKNGKPQQRRHRVRIPDMADEGLEIFGIHGNANSMWNLSEQDPTMPPFGATCELSWRRVKDAYEVATCRYSIYVPGMSKAQEELRSFQQAFGLEWDPRIIWDAIPWSFVIDWFVSVGDWIDKWDGKRGQLPVYARVHDMTITRRFECEGKARYRWIHDKPNGEFSPEGEWIFKYHTVACKAKMYTRVNEVRLEAKDTDLESAGFTAIERQRLLNGASLITVNTKGPDIQAPRTGPKNRNKKQRKWPPESKIVKKKKRLKKQKKHTPFPNYNKLTGQFDDTD